MHHGHASWLSVKRNSAAGSWPHLFIDTPEWGLHRYDMSLALDALLNDVEDAEAAYREFLGTRTVGSPSGF